MPKKSKDNQNGSANGHRSRVKKAPERKPVVKRAVSRKLVAATKTDFETKPLRPSEEEIRLRAYFIAERRTQLSLKGDHNSDWLEAKRQLFVEAGIPLG